MRVDELLRHLKRVVFVPVFQREGLHPVRRLHLHRELLRLTHPRDRHVLGVGAADHLADLDPRSARRLTDEPAPRTYAPLEHEALVALAEHLHLAVARPGVLLLQLVRGQGVHVHADLSTNESLSTHARRQLLLLQLARVLVLVLRVTVTTLSHAQLERQPPRGIRREQTHHLVLTPRSLAYSVAARGQQVYHRLPALFDHLVVHVPQRVGVQHLAHALVAQPHAHPGVLAHAHTPQHAVLRPQRLHLHDERVLALALRLTPVAQRHIRARLAHVLHVPVAAAHDHLPVVRSGDEAIRLALEAVGVRSALLAVERAAAAHAGVVAVESARQLTVLPQPHGVARHAVARVLHAGGRRHEHVVVECRRCHRVLHPTHLHLFNQIVDVPDLQFIHCPYALHVQFRPTNRK